MTRERKVPPWLRDITTLLVGAGVFVWAAVSGADTSVLLISAALMAGPGVLQLWLLGRTPGDGSSSPSGPAVPLPPSPSPSPAPSTAGDP